jgi:spore coat polysaccharide biosynthesis protein SpsF
LQSGIIGIIQARLTSQRLPAKVLAPLAGRPLLAVLQERLASARVDEWWLATSHDQSDDVLAAWGEVLGFRVHRGNDEDVLSRFTAIIRQREPNWIVRITADNPFLDGAIVNALIDALPDAEKSASLIGIGDELPVFPLGYGAQLAKATDVVESESQIPDDQFFHRSHVLSWLRLNATTALADVPAGWPRRPEWRWTVDTEIDLRMARAAFGVFGDRWPEIDYPKMVAALDAHPDIAAINRDVRQKELTEG